MKIFLIKSETFLYSALTAKQELTFYGSSK